MLELRKWIFLNGLTNTSFAKKIGIARSHLQGILGEYHNPSPELRKKIEIATKGAIKAASWGTFEDYRIRNKKMRLADHMLEARQKGSSQSRMRKRSVTKQV